jgi:hypothetical protein
VGESFSLTVQLSSTAARTQTLAIDYAVHHVKADGSTSPKVFKGWSIELPAQGCMHLVKQHSMRPVTTRRYHAGRHTVALQINGRVEATADFVLQTPG